MGRHKEHVKLLVRNVVHQELVKRAPTILIPVLQVMFVNVVQLPHVEELQCLIISVQTLRVNVDHRLHALRELQYQHVYPQLVQPQHQLTQLLLAR